jgi:serine/threonine-protein kinase
MSAPFAEPPRMAPPAAPPSMRAHTSMHAGPTSMRTGMPMRAHESGSSDRATSAEITTDVAEPVAPPRSPVKPAIMVAAALAAGIAVGFVAHGSGGASPSASDAATLKVISSQPGVKLLVDGKDLGSLPHEVPGLLPGEHVVSLQGDGYVASTTTVALGPKEKRDLDPPMLKVARGSATFDVKTPGATVVLVAPDERREILNTSHAIDVDLSKSWTLEAQAAGYDAMRTPLTFEDRPAKTFTVALNETGKHDAPLPEPVAAADPAPSADTHTAATKASPAANDAPKTESAVQHKTVAAAPDTAKPTQPAATPASGTCKLNINSIPVSKVLLDGRPIGLTPKVGVTVPAGAHTVVFVGDHGKKSVSSTCQAGEQKAVAAHL